MDFGVGSLDGEFKRGFAFGSCLGALDICWDEPVSVVLYVVAGAVAFCLTGCFYSLLRAGVIHTPA